MSIISGEFSKPWLDVVEDENGRLCTQEIESFHRHNRKEFDDRKVLKRVVRYTGLLIDFSLGLTNLDYKPNSLVEIIKSLNIFIPKYIETNPLSKLGIYITRNSSSECLSPFSSLEYMHTDNLKKFYEPGGSPSLCSVLKLYMTYFSLMPEFAHKECIIVWSSICTIDSDNIYEIIHQLKDKNAICNVFSLSGEIYILKQLASLTGGQFFVPLDQNNYNTLLSTFIQPSPLFFKEIDRVPLITIGFPSHYSNCFLCACHNLQKNNGFQCPRCLSIICSVPNTCPICLLLLTLPSHISKTFQHVNPPSNYIEIKKVYKNNLEDRNSAICFGCKSNIQAVDILECKKCHHLFCINCDLFIHETLKICPGCMYLE